MKNIHGISLEDIEKEIQNHSSDPDHFRQALKSFDGDNGHPMPPEEWDRVYRQTYLDALDIVKWIVFKLQITNGQAETTDQN